MGKPLLYFIADLDGFVLDSAEGELETWHKAGAADVTIHDVRTRSPEDIGRERAEAFLSFRNLIVRDPDRLKYDKPMPGAVEALYTLVENDLYMAAVTSRTEPLREGTLESFRRIGLELGFEEPSRVWKSRGTHMLYMRDPRRQGMNEKSTSVEDLQSRGVVVAGGGDRPEDAIVYQVNDVHAIVLETTRHPRSQYAPSMVDNVPGPHFISSMSQLPETVARLRGCDVRR